MHLLSHERLKEGKLRVHEAGWVQHDVARLKLWVTKFRDLPRFSEDGEEAAVCIRETRVRHVNDADHLDEPPARACLRVAAQKCCGSDRECSL